MLHVIAGPTASGKTSLAIKIATHFNTKIISADSRQCYTEMNIGVAKPTSKELASIPHHFINTHSIHQPVTAGAYEKIGLQYVQDVLTTNKVAVLVGGTGLYIQALCEGLDIMPAINKDIDNEVNNLYQQNGLAWLQTTITKEDPLFATTLEINNPHRLLRALVFIRSTGQSITTFRNAQKKIRPFEIKYWILDLPRADLYNNINTRVDNMMNQGLLQEAEALLPYKHLKPLQTIGYYELFDYLQLKQNINTSVALIKQHTRNYAKRQITWFKKKYENNFHSSDSILEQICK